MSHYPIVTKSDPAIAFVDIGCLPAGYMQDFSVLGFRVDRCEKAIRELLTNHIDVRQVNERPQAKIDSPSQVCAVRQLLADNDLACDIADVAEGLYQG